MGHSIVSSHHQPIHPLATSSRPRDFGIDDGGIPDEQNGLNMSHFTHARYDIKDAIPSWLQPDADDSKATFDVGKVGCVESKPRGVHSIFSLSTVPSEAVT